MSVFFTVKPAYLQFEFNSASLIQHTSSGSQIGIETRLRARRSEVRILTEARDFYFLIKKYRVALGPSQRI